MTDIAVKPVGMAIVGCGYVADSYAQTLERWPELRLLGAFDIQPQRNQAFSDCYQVPAYQSWQQLLADGQVELVLNLTNPRSHFQVTSDSLCAGKHVYSEKPLGMDVSEAQSLRTLAQQRALTLACAPCSALGTTAQTLWRAVRQNAVGRIRLIYANFDDGMIAPNMQPWTWTNRSGAPWPAKDEFETGCTYEHAGYFLTWLACIFGPARRVTAFSACQIPDKGIAVDGMAPDFSVGCIEYDEGIVARVTCGLVAPHDKSMTIVGDEGTLLVQNLRNDREPVYRRRIPNRGWPRRFEGRWNRVKKKIAPLLLKCPVRLDEWFYHEKIPPVSGERYTYSGHDKSADFLRGPADTARAIREQRVPRLNSDLAVHVVELIQVLQRPEHFNFRHEMQTSFEPPAPLYG